MDPQNGVETQEKEKQWEGNTMRIVIVEDEIRIREGLSKLLRKIDPSYEVVGEAENGKTGLALAREQKPDLVITDIKMPEMDGLAMLESMQEEGLLIKAIVLSAYSEFAYAQQAIHLGVNEYILKPVSVGELSQSLKNVEEQLREEKKNKREHPRTLRSLENISYGLLMGTITLDKELCQFLDSQYQVDAGGEFVLLTFYLGRHYQKGQGRAAKEIERMLGEGKGFSYCLLQMPGKSEILALLYQCRDIAKIERNFSNYLVHHQGVAENPPMSVGWYAFQELEHLPEVFQTLQKQMDWALVMGSSVLIVYPKITQVQTQPLSYPVELEKEMREGLCSFRMEKVHRVSRAFRDYFVNGTVYSPREIKESYVRFLWSILNVAKEIDMESLKTVEQQELLEEIMSSITYDELEGILEGILERIPREQKKEDNYLIQRTKSLIHEFYQQGITLDEIAHQLKITPEYLGMQFHKETGCNFSSYMKNYRIKKAKELLLGSRMKLYEIAASVGYTDPKYFSRVFKEVTGELPAEYRKRHQ